MWKEKENTIANFNFCTTLTKPCSFFLKTDFNFIFLIFSIELSQLNLIVFYSNLFLFRCSINGHYYNRETSFFTPPFGSQMSVWVTSLVSTEEVINLMLDKYKVDSKPCNFALFVVRDNGGEIQSYKILGCYSNHSLRNRHIVTWSRWSSYFSFCNKRQTGTLSGVMVS